MLSFRPTPSALLLFVSSFATVFAGVMAASAEPKRNAVGYSSEWSVRPGDTLEFYVSAIGSATYEADLVRVVNGDSLSRYAEQFRVDEVKAPFAGTYEGIEQPLNTGSYVHIEEPKALDGVGSFTVAAWIYPTFNPDEYEAPDLDNIDPFSPPSLTMAPLVTSQTIVSRFDAATHTGWALQLDEKLRLSFVVGTGDDKLETIRLDESLRTWDWSYVAVSYDSKDRMVTLDLFDKPWAPGDRFTARQLNDSGKLKSELVQNGPLRIAAVRGGPGAATSKLERPGDVFNGRIQDVRVAARVLSAKEIDSLSAETVPEGLKNVIVADWDFAKDMKTTRIRDIAGGADGVAVNIPDRAVRGVFWNGSTVRWTDAPDSYDAITFHIDDIYDAEWKSDFSYVVPEDLKSGIYAARVRRDDFTEYITFFVAAPKDKPRADLALWLSDYNYLAYTNITLHATAAKNYPGHNWNVDDTEFWRAHPEFGTGGVYNTHVDGLYFSGASRLRPDMQLKPGATVYNFAQDTHITAFLEHAQIPYDVITDEMVDREGLDLLKQYRAVISSTHHEYVTTQMFDDVRDYTADGGRFIYLGANGWFWAVDGHPTLPGFMESRNFHDIPERYLRSGSRGGLMIEAGRPSGPVFGVEMSAMTFNGSSAYRKLDDAKNKRVSFLFEGTQEGEVFGDYGIDRVHGGAAGFEMDRYNPGNGVPRHALNVATSEPLREKIENVQVSVLPLNISYIPAPKGDPWAQADVVFFETPNGGAMLSTGSINWISSTLENNFDNDIAKITSNAIRRFLDPKPFPPVSEEDVDEDLDRTPPGEVYEHADKQ